MTTEDRSLSPLRGKEREALLTRVAHQYWVAGITQEEIASRLAYSRVTVSRMLDEARQRGIVRITIGAPLERDASLEKALRRRFRIPDVRIARTIPRRTSDDAARFHAIAADAIGEHLRPDTRLAVASSRRMMPIVRAIAELPTGVSIVEALGHPLRGPAAPSSAAHLAASLGLGYHPLDAAFIHRTPERAEGARRKEHVVDALDLAERCDAILTGAGSTVRFDGTRLTSPLSSSELESIRSRGAVGHVCGHFFDRRGRRMPSILDDRRVGISFEALRATRTRILVVRGVERAPAVAAAARGSLASVLVTDDVTASAILDGSDPG